MMAASFHNQKFASDTDNPMEIYEGDRKESASFNASQVSKLFG